MTADLFASVTPPAYTPAELQEHLSQASGSRVLLMITDNTSSILTVKHAPGNVVEVRAHRMFLQAPPHVLKTLSRWIAGKRIRRDRIQEYIDANQHRIRERDPESRLPRLRARGGHHDLREIHERINRLYLGNRSRAKVTWGRKVTRRQVQSVRLGTYDPVLNLITLSQRLDRSDVPRYMVEYVMFHEMLHEVLGIGERADGRRDIHGKTFRLMEQTYPYYDKALAFEAKKWG